MTTSSLGRLLFSLTRRHPPPIAILDKLDERLMDWGMRDDQRKAHLFRFIDVLPSLRSPAQVITHLRDFSNQLTTSLPFPIRAAVRLLPQTGWLADVTARLAVANTRRMARRFIAAADFSELDSAIDNLHRQHLDYTIDVLGEAVLSESEALAYQSTYLRLIETLAASPSARSAEPNVSIKLSALFSQFDPIAPESTSAAVRDRLRPILRLARDRRVFVNIDMEQYAYKDLTLRIFREICDEPEFRSVTDVGIVIQAYLESAGDDLHALADWAAARGTPVWVRLVKGAYWDYETVIAAQNNWPIPVFTDKARTDANFETLTSFLFEHHSILRPAIASHNIRSIAHALSEAHRLHLDPRHYEFQMLYGMADPIKCALVELRQRVRVYAPLGDLLQGMAYLVRRLLENTSNESFLRAGFLEHVPEEQLLMNPLDQLKESDPFAASRPAPGAFINEPLSNFSEEPARRAMHDALHIVARQLGRDHPMVINADHRHPTRDSETITSINPARPSQIIGRLPAATIDDANAAVHAAASAFPAWRLTPPTERADLLFKAARIMRRRRFELAAWEVFETAKQWREADADVAEAIDYCDYYAREMLRLAPPRHRDVPGEDNHYFYDSRGVAVIIAPWNFPLAILCGMTAAALAAGNTAIMKPAEQSPVIAFQLMTIFEEAGFPRGVVNFLPGVGETVGPTLVNHPDVSIIAFTGSRPVGLSINRDAALTPPNQHHIKHAVIELGGKNAIIVDDDADLDETVAAVAASAFGYAGQKCSACSRVIVLETIYDAFLARLIETTRSLTVGPPEDPRFALGPVIDADAHARILKTLESARRDSRLVFPDTPSKPADPRDGYYITPHIFADVSPDSPLTQEEIFGPVLAVIKARDLNHAITIANHSSYALTGGLFSRSPASIAKVRRDFRVGNLYINRKITGALVDRQPFGGFNLSGAGTKAGGPDYLLHFLIPRTITENTLRRGFAPAQAATPSDQSASK